MSMTDSSEALLDGVDAYLREACAVDRLHKAFDGDKGLADGMWRGMLELGLGGVAVAEAHGGLGLGFADVAAIGERIGWAGAPGPWMAHTLAAAAIGRAGSPEQKRRWLPAMATGETVATVALCEDAAWRAQDWRLAPEPRLSGGKDYVLAADEADVAVVGLAGGKLGIVELNGPGVARIRFASTDRTRPVGRLAFETAPVDLLPEAFGAQLLDAAAILLAADAHGGSARMLADVVEYNKTRVQFDRPLAGFQAIKHKMADMATSIHPNAPLYRQAAATFEQAPAEAALGASLAKAHIAETFSTVARLCTEAYGGIGYTWEHWAHIWLRRAMFDYAWLGTPAAHRERCAELLGW
ncbi:MAG: acyl-CoA/acyl-ACP dehydrogenase [Caulobacteraceae bacterium]|nr:acyl-CoA/acyl-ACP dehydrogenase [Caulobacteraceae bacterium]